LNLTFKSEPTETQRVSCVVLSCGNALLHGQCRRADPSS
jgi:hypothetical protein